MTKGATIYEKDGLRFLQVVTRKADGFTGDVAMFPIRDKAEALAIAKRERAVFTA